MSRPWSGRTRAVTAVLAWSGALVAATLVGTTAVDAIGSGIVGAGRQPLSQSEVDARLSATGPTTTTVPPSTTTPPPVTTTTLPTTSATATAEVVSSRGGTVIARCSGTGVEIVSTTPGQGYQSSTESEADHPRVRFSAGRTRVEVRLRCVDGRIQPEIRNG
ncbi:hypothetical protein [Umezawaea sp. Da 62-37]|uniref:hypothetical protein n=1 Tax=Umezawaea sp. Da 62-37 TaxID=3075927 RepID=UPI0028F6D5ED|nr:hypothetical protein [Umezawaea sp. Da 62-37]WNV88427.1 hypothetical protein RM788_09065 [Umezawaea sp. Da 62-37]